MTHSWKGQRDAYKKALEYLQGRRKGTIKSFITPHPKVNDAGVAGWEWHSTIAIGARPGVGKTAYKDQVIRRGFELNKGENMRVLEFQFEMFGQTQAIREFCTILEKPYKYVCSAESPEQKLSDEELKLLYEHSKLRVEYPIDVVEKQETVPQMVQTIKKYMNHHKVDGVFKKTIVTLDHTLLVKRMPGESFHNMLYALGEAITELKREYPIIFLILSQLNRDIEDPKRSENGSYRNYALTSDFFGADALLMHCDIMMAWTKPSRRNIKYYGPDMYLMESDTLICHFLKVRNGDPRMSFFKFKGDTMEIVEINTPGRQSQKVSTKTA